MCSPIRAGSNSGFDVTRGLLRLAVALLLLAEFAAFGVLVYWGLNEGSGIRIAGPLAELATVVMGLFALPALVLVIADRLPWLAAVFACIPVLIALWGRYG